MNSSGNPSERNKLTPGAPGAGSRADAGNEARKHSKKKQKRLRGGVKKYRIIKVVQTGDTPRDKYLKGGRVRKLDVLQKEDEDALPRKTRDMLRRMAKVSESRNNKGMNKNKQTKKIKWKEIAVDTSRDKSNGNDNLDKQESETNDQPGKQEISWIHTDDTNGSNGNGKGEEKESSRDRALKGIQTGENYSDFMNRLANERKQLSVEAAREHNHQRAKKKAHYEKRALGKQRRKRRRRGEISSDDEGMGEDDDWNEHESTLSKLPMYWQEIVENHGRPISQKKRKKMERMEKLAEEKNDQEYVKFGEQVERPPTLTARPKHRRKKRV